jgi:hypothetical protein
VFGSTATKTFSITVAAALTITTTALPGGSDGTPYSRAIISNGGTAPLTWSIATGVLPQGLSLSSAGVISGTPVGTANASFSVRVVDQAGAIASQSLTSQFHQGCLS